ncbi:uncharacterized protein BCN122_II2980 [Burkholderia cenocepacia]|nr:uncharacterized protein BCN122_II2980 [Burkholderia cenocepacia]
MSLMRFPGKPSRRAPVPFPATRRNDIGAALHSSRLLGLLGTQFLDSPQ